MWCKDSVISDKDLVAKISKEYPNLILWLAGHEHRNTITPQPVNPSAAPGDPDYGHGLWEVEAHR